LKIESPNGSHRSQQACDGRKAERRALPKLNVKHSAPGQAVIGNRPAFDTAHNPAGKKKDQKVGNFARQEQGRVVGIPQQFPKDRVARFDQGNNDGQKIE